MAKSNLEKIIVDLLEKMDRQHSDVDKRLDNIEKVMLSQEINLQTHMKRSDTLEALYQTLKKEDIDPLKRHKAMVEGGLKALGVVSLLLSIIGGFLKIFGII